jgi:hypothetical protein
MSLTQVTPDVLHNIQSNVTQVGTLVSLTVTGNISSGNVTATNFTGTASLANNASFLGGTPAANYALGSAVTTANTAMKGYVDAINTTLTSNAAVQAGAIATLTANAAVQAGELATIQAGAIAKGYISFRPSDGAVFASKNLSVSKIAAGNFTITLAAGIQNGTVNYAPMVTAISRGHVVSSAFTTLNLEVYGVGIFSITSSNFTVLANSNYNTGLFYAGGNDGNEAQQFAAALFDPERITVVVF